MEIALYEHARKPGDGWLGRTTQTMRGNILPSAQVSATAIERLAYASVSVASQGKAVSEISVCAFLTQKIITTVRVMEIV